MKKRGRTIRKVVVVADVDPITIKEFDKYADEEHRSRQAQISYLIDKYVAHRRKKTSDTVTWAS